MSRPEAAAPVLPDEPSPPAWHDVVRVAWDELPGDLAGRLQDELSEESHVEPTPLGLALVDVMRRLWRPVLEEATSLPTRQQAIVHRLYGRAIASCPTEPMRPDVRCLAEGRIMLWSLEEAEPQVEVEE